MLLWVVGSCYGLNRPLQLLKRLKERHNHQQAFLRTRPVTVKTPIGITQSTSVSNQTIIFEFLGHNYVQHVYINVHQAFTLKQHVDKIQFTVFGFMSCFVQICDQYCRYLKTVRARVF